MRNLCKALVAFNLHASTPELRPQSCCRHGGEQKCSNFQATD